MLSYHIVSGKLDSNALKTMKSAKTMEGHNLEISTKGSDMYVNKALVLMTDIPCSNGVIHILDEVVMPPLSH